MSAHIHTYTYKRTHMQNVYMNARKHAWNDGAAANVQGAVADQGSFALLFGTQNLFWIEPKNWCRRQSMSMQITIIQSLTGVAQSKKERRQDDSVNR